MALSTQSLTSTTSVTRVQYQQAPVQQPPAKTTAQKEQESPTLNLTSGNNDLGQPNIDGTGATFSILV